MSQTSDLNMGPLYSLAPRGPCEKGLWGWLVYRYYYPKNGQRTPRFHVQSHKRFPSAVAALKHGAVWMKEYLDEAGLSVHDPNDLIMLNDNGEKVHPRELLAV